MQGYKGVTKPWAWCLQEERPIPLQAYIHLAKLLHKSINPEHIVAHLFLLLDWNLISGADVVAASNIEIVGFWNDTNKFQIGFKCRSN